MLICVFFSAALGADFARRDQADMSDEIPWIITDDLQRMNVACLPTESQSRVFFHRDITAITYTIAFESSAGAT